MNHLIHPNRKQLLKQLKVENNDNILLAPKGLNDNASTNYQWDRICINLKINKHKQEK